MKQANRAIVIYDHECAFCTHSILFVVKRDYSSSLVFTPLYGTTARAFFKEKNIVDTEQIWLITTDGTYYCKSSASLRIIAMLGGLYTVVKVLLLIPAPIRDWFYMQISNRRKSILRDNVCPLIPNKYQHMFTD